jgi:hypothetical protein
LRIEISKGVQVGHELVVTAGSARRIYIHMYIRVAVAHALPSSTLRLINNGSKHT